jgi:S-adenosylmethionine decarboxylase proenzyme
MRTLGRHLLAELYGCDAAGCDDLERVAAAMRQAAAAVGVAVMAEAFHRYAPRGVSGVMLIAESHLSVHTWPEASYAAVDIYTCGGLDPRPGVALLAGALGAAEVRMHEVLRGVPEDLGPSRPLTAADVTVRARAL